MWRKSNVRVLVAKPNTHKCDRGGWKTVELDCYGALAIREGSGRFYVLALEDSRLMRQNPLARAITSFSTRDNAVQFCERAEPLAEWKTLDAARLKTDIEVRDLVAGLSEAIEPDEEDDSTKG